MIHNLNKIPFEKLRIAYFRVYDRSGEKIFLDATDEQILYLLAKEYHETVVLNRIEDVEVLSVITAFPKKNKLEISELKIGISNKEFFERSEKFNELKQKYR